MNISDASPVQSLERLNLNLGAAAYSEIFS